MADIPNEEVQQPTLSSILVQTKLDAVQQQLAAKIDAVDRHSQELVAKLSQIDEASNRLQSNVRGLPIKIVGSAGTILGFLIALLTYFGIGEFKSFRVSIESVQSSVKETKQSLSAVKKSVDSVTKSVSATEEAARKITDTFSNKLGDEISQVSKELSALKAILERTQPGVGTTVVGGAGAKDSDDLLINLHVAIRTKDWVSMQRIVSVLANAGLMGNLSPKELLTAAFAASRLRRYDLAINFSTVGIKKLTQDFNAGRSTNIQRQRLANLHSKRGYAFGKRSKLKEALSDYKDCRRISKDTNVECLNNMSTIYLEQGQTAQACDVLVRASKIEPSSSSVANNLALCYGALARSYKSNGEANKASQQFARAKNEASRSEKIARTAKDKERQAHALIISAMLFSLEGSPAEAANYAEQAYALNPVLRFLLPINNKRAIENSFDKLLGTQKK